MTSHRSCCRRRPPRAKVIGLANAGGDTINSIRQASEFGIVASGQELAGLFVFFTDVHSLGLKVAQGLIITSAWYWDKDDASRAFAKRFMAGNPNGLPPTYTQAGVSGHEGQRLRRNSHYYFRKSHIRTAFSSMVLNTG
jgi:hypothetical protein